MSTTFPVHGIEYSQVYGRVIGYQDKTPDAFSPYYDNRSLTIDDSYVNGISLTHGQSLRQHIWTFAAAVDEERSDPLVCPCILDQTSPTQELYLPSLAKTTSVRLEVETCFNTYFTLMIHSGMVRDVGVPVLAAPSTIHHGSVNNSHSQLLTILS